MSSPTLYNPTTLSRHDSAASTQSEMGNCQPHASSSATSAPNERVKEPRPHNPTRQHIEHISTASTSIHPLQDPENPITNARTRLWLSPLQPSRPQRCATFPSQQRAGAESAYHLHLACSHSTQLQRAVGGPNEEGNLLAAQAVEIQRLRERVRSKDREAAETWQLRSADLRRQVDECVLRNQELLHQAVEMRCSDQRGCRDVDLDGPGLNAALGLVDSGDDENDEQDDEEEESEIQQLEAVIVDQHAELQSLHHQIHLLRERCQAVQVTIEEQRQLINGYRADIGDLRGLLRDKEREKERDLGLEGDGGWAIVVILGLAMVASWLSSLGYLD